MLDLPHSDACFVKAYPAETTEAFCDGGRVRHDPTYQQLSECFPGPHRRRARPWLSSEGGDAGVSLRLDPVSSPLRATSRDSESRNQPIFGDRPAGGGSGPAEQPRPTGGASRRNRGARLAHRIGSTSPAARRACRRALAAAASRSRWRRRNFAVIALGPCRQRTRPVRQARWPRGAAGGGSRARGIGRPGRRGSAPSRTSDTASRPGRVSAGCRSVGTWV